jgi:hypothetical protein
MDDAARQRLGGAVRVGRNPDKQMRYRDYLKFTGPSSASQVPSEMDLNEQDTVFAMFAQPRIRKSALVPPPKKRKTAHTIEEITFDKDARAEYLTGFHKRKQARIKHAQEVAEQRARQERIEMRKQV